MAVTKTAPTPTSVRGYSSLTADQVAWLGTRVGPAAMQTATQLWADPINGKDNASGKTQGTGVKTWREVLKRIAAYPLSQPVLDVRFTSAPPVGDAVRMDVAVQSTAGGVGPHITFYGPALVTQAQGTLSAVIARNRATNVPWDVQDGAVTTTADVASRIRIDVGARAGATTWVSKSTGAGRRRTGEWGTWDIVNGGTRVTPQAGDHYVVETSPGAQHLDYIRVISGDSGVYPNQVLVTFKDWDFTSGTSGGVSWVENRCAQLTFMNCRFRAFDNVKVLTPVASPQVFTYFENCCGDNTTGEIRFVQGGNPGYNLVDGGLYVNALLAEGGGGVWLDFDVLIDGSSSLGGGGTIGALGGGSQVQIASAGIMDSGPGGSGQGALVSRDGGVLIVTPTNSFYGSTGQVWGVSAFANSLGARIDDGGRMRVRTPANMTVTGAAGDFKMCGSATAYPWDPATRTHLAAVNCTWANLAAKTILEDPLHDAKVYVSSGVSFPA